VSVKGALDLARFDDSAGADGSTLALKQIRRE
jgi:hypothetical protein